MRIKELIEATFQGEPCTRDCSGHDAGYRWAMKNADKNCGSRSPSFSAGCNVAKKQIANKTVKKPVVAKDQDSEQPNQV